LKKIEPDSKNDNLTYYWKMGGARILRCNNCDFKQDIVSFLHGADSWSNTGFQCQDCGEIHEIEYDTETSLGRLCDCGGVLSREEPLFCPNCRTNDIRYCISYMT